MGWLPDPPDFRDYSETHEEIEKIIGEGVSSGKIKPGRRGEDTFATSPFNRTFGASDLPPAVDLCDYCSPVEDARDAWLVHKLMPALG